MAVVDKQKAMWKAKQGVSWKHQLRRVLKNHFYLCDALDTGAEKPHYDWLANLTPAQKNEVLTRTDSNERNHYHGVSLLHLIKAMRNSVQHPKPPVSEFAAYDEFNFATFMAIKYPRLILTIRTILAEFQGYEENLQKFY